MPDIPEAAVEPAAKAMRELHHLDPEQACTLARAALDAAAPVLAEAVAQKILAHAERQHPRDPDHVPAAWHRHFAVAARVAAGAFDTREDQLRMAAEAIGRGVVEVTREEGRAVLDRAAREALGISGEEFLARWDAGQYEDDGNPAVARVAMLIPFARVELRARR